MIKQVGIEALFLSPQREGRVPVVSSALLHLVREFGPIEPVIVRPGGPRRYEILANAQTWLAAQQTGHHDVPILVRDNISEAEVEALLHYKAPEHCIDIARRYAAILDARPGGRAYGAISDLAVEEGCSRSHVAHLLRILSLPELIQDAIGHGLLNLGQAKALLCCASTEDQMTIAAAAIKGRWSVRRTEQAVRDSAGRQPVVGSPPALDPQIKYLERRLGDLLGSPVSLDTEAGLLVIDYRKDLGVLSGVMERLGYSSEQ